MARIGFVATEAARTLDQHAAAFRDAGCVAVYAHVPALLGAVVRGDEVVIPSATWYPREAHDVVDLLTGLAELGATVRHADGTMDTATVGGRLIADNLVVGAEAVIERRKSA